MPIKYRDKQQYAINVIRLKQLPFFPITISSACLLRKSVFAGTPTVKLPIMYIEFFRLTRAPFSISPDPRYLFMSERHHDALAHLMYGASGGGVVVLTGEIGAGKTTICRCFLEQVPANCNVAYIFNPKLSVAELLQTICEEFHMAPSVREANEAGVKHYVDALNRYLLDTHAQGRNNVLIIDEAQNLSADVLEQLRLLTNLETNDHKLLQIILVGQPELREMLARPGLEQLAQRVIARYHLTALSEQETASYIQHRLSAAGLSAASPFQQPLMKQIHQITQGVPRRINLLCNRALLGAYAHGKHEVNREILAQAARELFDENNIAPKKTPRRRYAVALAAGVTAIGITAWTISVGSVRNEGFGAFAPDSAASDGIKQDQPITPVSAPAEAADAHAHAATSAPNTADAILSEQDGRSRIGLSNEDEAVRQLAKSWGVPPPDKDGGDPCDVLKKNGLFCYRSSGLGELRQLDRPAILKLHDYTNRTYYALLTGLADSSATLQVGAATQKVSLVILTRWFRGEFSLLWRAPHGFSGPVRLDDSGPQVEWIANQLAKIYGAKQQVHNQVFDQKMQKQIREFQAAQGLFVDGIAGPVTLMQLNRVAGLKEPHLNTAVATMNDIAGTEQ